MSDKSFYPSGIGRRTFLVSTMLGASAAASAVRMATAAVPADAVVPASRELTAHATKEGCLPVCAKSNCVASATSGQNASVEMRDFDLLRAPRRRSEVDEQTRTSTIYGRAETGDFTRGGPARRDGERGVPTPCTGGIGILSLACGRPGRLRGGAEVRCTAYAAQG